MSGEQIEIAEPVTTLQVETGLEQSPFPGQLLSRWLADSEKENLLTGSPLLDPIVKIHRIKQKMELFVVAPDKPWASRFFHFMATKAVIPSCSLHPELYAAVTARVGNCKDRVLIGYCSLDIPQKYGWMEKEKDFFTHQVKAGLLSERAAFGVMQLGATNKEERLASLEEKLVHYLSVFFKEEMTQYHLMAKQFICQVEDFWIKERDLFAVLKIIMRLIGFSHRLSFPSRFDPASFLLKSYKLSTNTALGPITVIGVCLAIELQTDFHLFRQNLLEDILASEQIDFAFKTKSLVRLSTQNPRHLLLYFEFFPKSESQKWVNKIHAALEKAICPMVHPLFVQRNEEELLRYSVVLANQVKSKKDVPHVAILFDRYSHREIHFSAAIVLMSSVALQSHDKWMLHIEMTPSLKLEKWRSLGDKTTKWQKELFIITGVLPTENYLRPDYTVDFFAARAQFLESLERVFGVCRDYNGAMMAEERKSYDELAMHFSQDSLKKTFFERFFCALAPAEARLIYREEILTLFEMVCTITSQKKELLFSEDRKFVVSTLARQEIFTCSSLEQKKNEILLRFELPVKEGVVWGYYFKSLCFDEKTLFGYSHPNYTGIEH